jgi:hypothetical protein
MSNLKDISLKYNDFEGNEKLFILISLLHINRFINNQSLFALFKSLKENKLNRYINTFHSKINDKWYNDEHITNVYEMILEDSISKHRNSQKTKRLNKLRELDGLKPITYKTELNFDDTLKYLNKYLNKNRNYCIDHLFHEFIKESISRYKHYQYTLNRIFDFDFEIFKKEPYDDYYCCEHCCGSYESWLEYREDHSYDGIEERICKEISEFLNTKREKYKGSYKEFKI